MDAQELIGLICVQNSGVAQARITSVASVSRDIATVRATNVKTGARGQVKIDLHTGREYLYRVDNPSAWVVCRRQNTA